MPVKDITMTTRKLDTKAIRPLYANYIGRRGEIFYDSNTITLRLSDGVTPGGVNMLGVPTYSTRLVNTSTYVATASDYYIGVNYAGPVSITLPTVSDGNQLIIKDESGNCANNPITLVGTVDNNTNIQLAFNNGSLTLIYRSGWRII
jgi:hypothetical protein